MIDVDTLYEEIAALIKAGDAMKAVLSKGYPTAEQSDAVRQEYRLSVIEAIKAWEVANKS